MHWKFLFFYLYGKRLASVADFFSYPGRTFCEQIADALTTGNKLDHFEHRSGVSEFQVDTPGVTGCQKPVLKTFHGERDAKAGRDSVKGICITQFASLRDGIQIIDTAGRTQRPDGFIL